MILVLLPSSPGAGASVTPSVEMKSILVVGDSISAAYGMDLEQGWVALLEQKIGQTALEYRVVNASISGETSGGALRRLPDLLAKHQPDVVIIELGGNDGLRGYPVDQLRQNLQLMVQSSQAQGARVILLPMEIPPNLGPRYASRFRESFTRVGQQTGARTTPFMLAGIADNPTLMQGDGIHPTVEAQALILDNLWPHILPVLTGPVTTTREGNRE